MRDVLVNGVLTPLTNAYEQEIMTARQLTARGTNFVQQDNHVDIRVQDNGPGVVQGDERKIFKPFYTTEPGATGLGLANVRQVVEIHGGMILASNIPTGGAIFTLRFPRKGRSAAA